MSVGDLALLQHDKPLAKGNTAPHLKHIPAYLRDPTLVTPSFPGNAGKGTHHQHIDSNCGMLMLGQVLSLTCWLAEACKILLVLLLLIVRWYEQSKARMQLRNCVFPLTRSIDMRNRGSHGGCERHAVMQLLDLTLPVGSQ